ncbi:CidA/LrgA family protein [Arhodomonas sp. AD133]|uniref:CidA/LrgA family protein n=1 Tax=Arhodomonas sp. AD133 TaxID=3415009 RepID=UPI003EBC7429
MVAAVLALLVCQLAGEILTRGLDLPLPGPVLGMLLLATALALRGGVPEDIARVARGLLDNLSLLFIPAGVGVIAHLSRLADAWLGLAVTVLVSTAITLVVSAATLRWLMRVTGAAEE